MIESALHERLTWQKATASLPGMNCVELAKSADLIALRDSKAIEHGALVFTRAELAAFLDGAKRGEFDHLV